MRKILWILFISFILILNGCKPCSIDDVKPEVTKKTSVTVVTVDADKICDYCGDEIVNYYSQSKVTNRIYHISCVKISGLEERIKELEEIIIELKMTSSKTTEKSVTPEKSNEPDLNGYYN